MACKNPDAPCPGCRKTRTACAADILQDLFDDLMAPPPPAASAGAARGASARPEAARDALRPA